MEEATAISDRVAAIVEREVPEMEDMYYIAQGGGSSMMSSGNSVTMGVNLVGKSERERSAFDIEDDLRLALQDIAGCFDQTAGLIFFLDDLDVRIDVGNRRDGFRNAGNVHFGIICALEHTVLSQRVHQSDNVHRFAFAEQAAHFLIDGPVLLRIEHIGVHLCDQAVQDGFIHQRCAKHALFRLHVIRQLNAQAGQA